LEALLNELMNRERRRYFEQHPKEEANGFYHRSLRLTIGDGYSQAQMERALKSLGLPFSKEALEDALALIRSSPFTRRNP